MISPTPFLEFLRDFKGSIRVCVRLGTWHELLQLSDFGDVMGVLVRGAWVQGVVWQVGSAMMRWLSDGKVRVVVW